jgi:hypothetical protein
VENRYCALKISPIFITFSTNVSEMPVHAKYDASAKQMPVHAKYDKVVKLTNNKIM